MTDDFVVKYTIDFEEDDDTSEPYAVILVDGFSSDESGVPIPLDAVGPLLSAFKEYVKSKEKKSLFKDGRKVHKKVTLTNHAYGVTLKSGRKEMLLEPPGIPFQVEAIETNAESWEE